MERTVCYKLIERFCEPPTESCVADKMNYSLLAMKNESQFHHSFKHPTLTTCNPLEQRTNRAVSSTRCHYQSRV